MSNALKLAIGATAVVVASLVGLNLLSNGTTPGIGASPPSSSPSPSPSPSPSATTPSLPLSGSVEPGTYRMYTPTGSTVAVDVTVPAGWQAAYGGSNLHIRDDQPDSMNWSRDPFVPFVYADACASEGTQAEVGPSVDDLVQALLDQENSEVTGPTDVTLGGYPAVRLDVVIPADLDMTTCRYGAEANLIQIWTNSVENDYFALGEDRDGIVYIADVEGERVVISADIGPEVTEADMAELDAMIQSITFAPVGG